MTFVQVIEFRTSDISAAYTINDDWWAATEGKRTARSITVTRDRSDSQLYRMAVVFDSYESAMENSALPETQAAAERYQQLSGTPPVFRNLDVLRAW